MKRGPGGTAHCGPPPPAATARIGAPQAPNTGGLKTGLSNTRLDLKKNKKNDIVYDFLKLPEKTRLAVDQLLE